MKVQKITEMSINTMKNEQGKLVSFSGNRKNVLKDGMPKVDTFVSAGKKNAPKTLLEEVSGVWADVVRSVKKNYRRSEIKKLIVDPTHDSWKRFTQNAPKLSQAVKGAVALAAVTGAIELMTKKSEKTEDYAE